MSEGGRSPKVRKPEEQKAERPKLKARKNPAVESQQPNLGDSVEDGNNASPIDIPHSELTKSETGNALLSTAENKQSRKIKHPVSEIKPQQTTPDSYRDSKPPTETMEVHHHPEIEKKGLREYILEGLMIFLAVMMGFFAESLRERISENNRAKEYAVTLYSDLKSDTLELNAYLKYYRFSSANTDTLMQLLSSADARQITTGKLYWFGLFGGAYHIFSPHNATMVEMKSSGSLRFFGDKIINRKLALYDQLCDRMKLSEEKEAGIYVETRKARARIFEFKYNEAANDIFHGMKKAFTAENPDPYGVRIVSRQAMVDSFKKTRPPLLSYDKTLFNEYVEMVRSRYLGLKVAAADTLLHHATELLGLLNKKYDLQGE